MIILKDKAIKVNQPQQIAEVLQRWLSTIDDTDRLKEHFFVVLLDARLKLLLVDVVAVGTLNAALIHPREVFIRAISAAASSFLIAHNHPSGDSEPSDADISLTKRLQEAGRLLGIELLDHLILTASGYYSFRADNRLP